MTAMNIPRTAFWIKLGRLAAMLDELDDHVAFLENWRRTQEWKNLDTDARNKLAKLHHFLEGIRSLD